VGKLIFLEKLLGTWSPQRESLQGLQLDALLLHQRMMANLWVRQKSLLGQKKPR